MNIKYNILANYISTIYVTIIGVVMVPLYIQYMGVEAYGMVGFYAMLQAWFVILDVGLTATIARETARYRGGVEGGFHPRMLLRTLEGIFIVVGAFGAILIASNAEGIATDWLNAELISTSELIEAIVLIGCIVAMRWISGLYRGVVSGYEKFVWLSGFNVIIVTMRFVLVLPVFIYVGTSLEVFFKYQLIIAIVELVVVVLKAYNILPKIADGVRVSWQWQPLRGVLKFSLGIAFTTSIWVLVTQVDKLLLSKLLSLSDYGVFTLAVLVASALIVIRGPIATALMPRMTKLEAEGNKQEFYGLYKKATQLVSIVITPVILIMSFYAEELLWMWTGDMAISQKAAPVLTLYAIGNGILALAAFPFYLQYAKGDLKYHIWGNAVFILTFIPMLYWGVVNYGMMGAGYAWLLANLLPFILWVPFVHSKFAPGLHINWLFSDILVVVTPALLAMLVFVQHVSFPASRFEVGLSLTGLGLVLLCIAALSSSWCRSMIMAQWKKQFVH